MVPATPLDATTTTWMYQSLLNLSDRLDTSKIERLRIADGILLDNCCNCVFYGLLSRMKSLRTLTISRCTYLSASLCDLGNNLICPNLEELILDPRVDKERFNIRTVIRIAAMRASTGPKLKFVRIVSGDKSVQAHALELWKYVGHVECSPRVAAECDESDSSDEED